MQCMSFWQHRATENSARSFVSYFICARSAPIEDEHEMERNMVKMSGQWDEIGPLQTIYLIRPLDRTKTPREEAPKVLLSIICQLEVFCQAK